MKQKKFKTGFRKVTAEEILRGMANGWTDIVGVSFITTENKRVRAKNRQPLERLTRIK
jgi:hypothetical protein